MSNETPERRGGADGSAPSLEAWLDDLAEKRGIGRERLLTELVTAAWEAEDEGPSVEDRVDRAVEERVGALESRTDDHLEEIRRRVVQLKRETDDKADAETAEHLGTLLERFDDRLSALESELSSVGDALDGVAERVEEVNDRTEDGREPSDAFHERFDDIEEKLTRVARATVALRGAEAEAETLRSLKRAAARERVDRASCGECGERIDLVLLLEPNCPHCGEAVSALSVEGDGDPRLTDPEGDR
jgi:chromosome segregation ATPase